MLTRSILLSLFSLLFCFSCTKDEGQGGRATIQGKLYVLDYNLEGELKDEFYAPDEDVFIVYGDDAFYGDNVKTHYDGTYQFNFLQKGSYQIYAYSRCDSCASGTEPKFINVEIDDSNDLIILEDLVVDK